MGIVLFILVAFCILTGVSGAYVFVLACVRKKDAPWLEKDKLQNTAYGKYSDYIASSYQWLVDHNFQDVTIESFDRLKLHGYWVAADNPKGTVLLVHGYRSTALLDFGLAFDFYYSRGYNLLIPQQRSHGDSQGRFITFGVKESRDMATWINYHNERFGDCPIILNGISMGASTVLYLVDKKLPANVKGVVADCGFTSPKDIISVVYRGVIRLPAIPTMWAVEFFTRVIAGFSLTEETTPKSLANCHLPVLMIHGKADGFVPCDMSVKGYDACTGNKRLFLVDGADHGVSFLVDTKGYTQVVDEFLDTVIGGENELRGN